MKEWVINYLNHFKIIYSDYELVEPFCATTAVISDVQWLQVKFEFGNVTMV